MRVLVVCPNPSCPSREVKDGEVSREGWEATWHEASTLMTRITAIPGYWTSEICCVRCGTEGIDPESGQLDSAEEELGVRCPECGVVWAPLRNRTEGAPNGYCPNDGTELPA